MSDIDIYESRTTAPDYLKGIGDTVLRFDVLPNIQQEDIDRGSIIRYFARQVNVQDGEIVEINKSKFDRLKNIPLYQTINVPWRITGPLDNVSALKLGVITANKMAVADADKILSGMGKKLTNPIQFYKGI